MAAAVTGLFGDGETEIEHAESVEDVYPGFGAMLARFQMKEISRGIEIPVISSVPSLRPGERGAIVGAR
jgi:hypothetical protein